MKLIPLLIRKKTLLKSLILLMILFTGAYWSEVFNHAAFVPSGPDPFDYEKVWKSVEENLSLDKPESARKLVQQIHQRAKNEKNIPHWFKAVCYLYYLSALKDEFPEELAHAHLQKEIKSAPFPLQALFRSLLAELELNYLNNHYWQREDLSFVPDQKSDSIQHWDMQTLSGNILKNYLASIQEKEKLVQIPVDNYAYLLLNTKENGKKYRPTLYDILAHRALQGLQSSHLNFGAAGETTNLYDPVWFSNTGDFIKISHLKHHPSPDVHFLFFSLMQDLLETHYKLKNQEALFDLEMQRFNYLMNHSLHENKWALLRSLLQEWKKQFTGEEQQDMLLYQEAHCLISQGSGWNPGQSDSLRWKLKKGIQILEKIKNKETQAGRMAYNKYQSLTLPVLQNVRVESAYEPGKPALINASLKNIRRLYFRMIATSAESILQWEENYYDHFAKISEELRHSRPVLSFSREWNLPDDYHLHQVEMDIPSAETGNYFLWISHTPDFSAKENIVAIVPMVFTRTGMLMLDKRKEQVFWFMDRFKGHPLSHKDFILYKSVYNHTRYRYEWIEDKKIKSNEQGEFILNKEMNTSRNIRFKYEENKHWFYTPDAYHSAYYEWKHPKEIQSVIFTDRAIYRPGQTIHFKGVVWENPPHDGEKKVLQGHKVKVTLYDANHEKRSEETFITNEWGTYQGTFRIPTGLLNGSFYLTDGMSNHSFRVEEYKRPTFFITLRPPDKEFGLNDTVEIWGKVKTYSGQSLNDCKIKFTVWRRTSLYRTYGWWRCYPFPTEESEKVIATGNIQSNDTGSFRINFLTVPDLSKNPDQTYFEYTVQVEATDISGETHAEDLRLSAGIHPVKLYAEVPEHIELKAPAQFTVHATNLSGKPLSVPLQITLFRVEAPTRWTRPKAWNIPDLRTLDSASYVKTFPQEEYGTEMNVFRRKREKIKEWYVKSSTEKPVVIDKNEWGISIQGEYILQVITRDKNGKEIPEEKDFVVFDEKATLPPVPGPLWHETSQNEGVPGKDFIFRLKSSFPEVPVKYFTEDKTKISGLSFLKPGPEEHRIPVEEKHRGNFGYHLVCVYANRMFQHQQIIQVPHSNRQLHIEVLTFRDKTTPGAREEWKIKITDDKGNPASSEILSGMYDGSLDVFTSHSWYFFPWGGFYPSARWHNFLNETSYARITHEYSEPYKNVSPVFYPELNTFYMKHYFGSYYGYRYRGRYYPMKARGNRSAYDEPSAVLPAASMESGEKSDKDQLKKVGKKKEEGTDQSGIPETKKQPQKETSGKTSENISSVRKNFNETAFFFPDLKTNEKGEVFLSFTMPDALTTWKWMGLAHTKDLKTGSFIRNIISSKDLMIQPNMPRFFRENDQMILSSKISNQTHQKQTIRAGIQFFDPETDRNITSEFLDSGEQEIKTLSVVPGGSMPCSWNIRIPSDRSWVKIRISAQGEGFSDAEEHLLPVLSNRLFITQSMPFWARAHSRASFSFDALKNNTSSTLRHHRLTIEWTPQPVWNAVQALPYIMEYPYECSEQTFARFYANTLASHITDKMPRIREVFAAWKNSKDALLSALEKNQDLKLCLLEESPWVLEAREQSKQKERIALLFDLNRMAHEKQRALDRLYEMQLSNGGFCWFKGGPDSYYITQYIVEGMGHLIRLGVLQPDERLRNMLSRAVEYCDRKMKQYFEEIKKYDKQYMKNDYLSEMIVHYLYARSFFPHQKMTEGCSTAYEFFVHQAKTFWKTRSVYMKSMLALFHYRRKDEVTAKNLMTSIKEYSLFSEEMGRYWKYTTGWYWYEHPVETQALVIEALDEVEGNKEWADECRIWLLRQKQTQHWPSTKSTASAVYALLLRGSKGWEDSSEWTIQWGDTELHSSKMTDVSKESGSGYFRMDADLIHHRPESFARIQVENKGNSMAWGAVYWQYREDQDKVLSSGSSSLKVEKQIYRVLRTANGEELQALGGETKPRVGDRLRIRLRLISDRNYEFVHLKDQRAACLEPVQNLSGYHWQNGLGYYQNIKDASCNFFFDYLPKGTYQFEYDVFVNAAGNFSQGPARVQCMYAPEFGSQTSGTRLRINP